MNQKNNEQPLQYVEMQKMISLHIWKNDHLREEVIKNPKSTIERELGVKFSDDVEVNIVNHDDPNEVTFILPAVRDQSQELSEEDLDQVAGGISKAGYIAWMVLNAPSAMIYTMVQQSKGKKLFDR